MLLVMSATPSRICFLCNRRLLSCILPVCLFFHFAVPNHIVFACVWSLVHFYFTSDACLWKIRFSWLEIARVGTQRWRCLKITRSSFLRHRSALCCIACVFINFHFTHRLYITQSSHEHALARAVLQAIDVTSLPSRKPEDDVDPTDAVIALRLRLLHLLGAVESRYSLSHIDAFPHVTTRRLSSFTVEIWI